MGDRQHPAQLARVLEALRQDSTLTVLTDVDVDTGRADAVIFIPDRGAVVLHVHDGPAVYAMGRFACSRAHGSTCNPAAHALQLTYGLRRLVRQAWPGEPWLHVVPALLLPDVSTPDPLGPWAYPQALITADHLDDPLPLLLEALDDRGCDADMLGTRLPGRAQLTEDGPGTDWVSAVANLLTDPDVRARVTDPRTRVRVPAWNDEQQRILSTPGLDKVVLAGVHGSGKTAMAQEKARSWLAQGLRVAVLTFHPGVAAEWRAAFAHESPEAQPFFIGTVRGYLGSLKAGRTITHDGDVVELEAPLIGGRDLVTSLVEFTGPPLDADCVVLEGLTKLPLDIWKLVPDNAHGVVGTILKRPDIVPKNVTDFPDGVALRHLPKTNYRAAGDVVRICVGQANVTSARGVPGRVRRVNADGDEGDVLEAAWDEEWRLIAERGWLPEDIAVVETREEAVLTDLRLTSHRKDAKYAAWFDEAVAGYEVVSCAVPTLPGITKKVVVLVYTALPDRQKRFSASYLDDTLGQVSDMLVVVTRPRTRLLQFPLHRTLPPERTRREDAEPGAAEGRGDHE